MAYKESYTVELKRELNADFKKEIIAFANCDGGEIYVGVYDDGKVIGIDNAEKTMEAIGNMIRDGIKPDLTAYTSIEEIKENDLSVIRVTVLRGTKRPYHLTDKGLKSTGVFVRHGISSVPATDEMIREMLRESGGVAFDKSRCINQELTFNYADSFFSESGVAFGTEQKRTLGLIDADGYYTNAALLISDQCEHSIKCAVYDGTGKTKFKMRKEYNGSILKQMNEAYEYINLSNNLNSTFDGLKRVEHPDYPEFAVREALINAIVHRDYDYSGSIIVNIFDDRIELVSLGGLVKGITVEDIKNGISQARNTIIANVFYRLKLIESYGTGIKRIVEAYQKQALQPCFNPATASFAVTLPKMINSINDNMSDRDKALAVFKAKDKVTRKDIEIQLDCSKSVAVKILNSLIEDGLIEKFGEARAVAYKIK